MVQSNKYDKSRAVGVTSKVGLTTDRDLSVLTLLKKPDVFYSSEIPEVTWYEPLYNRIIFKILNNSIYYILWKNSFDTIEWFKNIKALE